MMVMNKHLIFSILLVLAALFLRAQETSDCSKTLKKAQRVYDAGEIEKVESMLQQCLKDGFTRAERTEALKLIILVNLFEDDPRSADNNMKRLLTINPDFKPKENDHQEIKDLYAKFRTDPLIIFDFMVGVNLSYGYLMTAYSVDHFNANSSYLPKVGINGGLIANYFLKESWRGNIGFFYRTKNYNIVNSYNVETDLTPEDELKQTIDANVNVTSIAIPFGITKEFGKRKLTPHVGIGGSFETYFNSSHTITRVYSDAAFAPEQGTAVDTEKQSSLFNISATTNAGVRYKIGLTGKLILDVRFGLGLWNQSRVNNRYENSQLLYQYYFVPDDFLLHNLSFNIGYSQLLYKPKKLKN